VNTSARLSAVIEPLGWDHPAHAPAFQLALITLRAAADCPSLISASVVLRV
jgi:hypothetical protein